MASMTVSKLPAPSTTSLTREVAKVGRVCRSSVQPQLASLKNLASNAGKLMVGISAGVLLGASTASANSFTVDMGRKDGSLLFAPNELSITAGDTVNFVNIGGFPHNVVFESGPDGVDVDKLSHEDLFNAPGETYTVTFSDKGTYQYYCEPHQGVGMTGTITVN